MVVVPKDLGDAAGAAHGSLETDTFREATAGVGGG